MFSWVFGFIRCYERVLEWFLIHSFVLGGCYRALLGCLMVMVVAKVVCRGLLGGGVTCAVG